MSGGCDTTTEDRERWDREKAVRENARRTERASAVTLVIALLPDEFADAKRWLDGYAAALRQQT